jgi:hypothetical protein
VKRRWLVIVTLFAPTFSAPTSSLTRLQLLSVRRGAVGRQDAPRRRRKLLTCPFFHNQTGVAPNEIGSTRC